VPKHYDLALSVVEVPDHEHPAEPVDSLPPELVLTSLRGDVPLDDLSVSTVTEWGISRELTVAYLEVPALTNIEVHRSISGW
jgi:hypothetical protein